MSLPREEVVCAPMMSQPSTTYAVINTGSGAPQVISGFRAADGLTLIGFLGPELTFAPTAADATAQGGCISI